MRADDDPLQALPQLSPIDASARKKETPQFQEKKFSFGPPSPEMSQYIQTARQNYIRE